MKPSKGEELYKNLEQHENLFKSIPREDSLEFQEREAIMLLCKAAGIHVNGNLDLALDYYNKSLALLEQVDPHSYLIIIILMWMSLAYQAKGELNLALKYAESSLSLIPEGEYFFLLLMKATLRRSMGLIYLEKGDLNKALECGIIALEIQKKIKNNRGIRRTYFFIIEILLAKKDVSQARNYLQQFKQFTEKNESRYVKETYQGARALVLKSSPLTVFHVYLRIFDLLQTKSDGIFEKS